MHDQYVKSTSISRFHLWDKMKARRDVISFNMDLTARCNNNCRHCYINLPADDRNAYNKELSLNEIMRIVDEAIELGAFWCLLSGGEPLLRNDFFDIYTGAIKKGLLVSVFTNATLITEEHIKLFKKYPPRDIEVSVYGVSKETYEKVTRLPGSFDKFIRGVDLLLTNKIRVRFKAMALRSNVHELSEISDFCRALTKDYFRFDPQLHLRYDGDPVRNEEIKAERLSNEDVAAIEKADIERFDTLVENCDKYIFPESSEVKCNHIFHCGAGKGSFSVNYDGYFRLCSSLCHPDCIFDLKKGTLAEAWNNFAPSVLDMRSENPRFMEKCHSCSLINLCLWCPAHSYLETGELDEPVELFCQIAKARAAGIKNIM